MGVTFKMMREILLDHFFDKLASGDAEVAPRPEMSSPVSLFHHWEFFKDLDGRTAFDVAHYFRWRDFWRSRDQNVHMVFTHNSPQDLNFKPLADLAYKFADSHGKVALENLVPVFRYQHEVVLNFVLGVAATALGNAHFLKQLLAESYPAKAGCLNPKFGRIN
jgi:hypothetical protein